MSLIPIMSLDCEMDLSFAKRLQTQQMRSPTSILINRPINVTSPCKRRLEPDVSHTENNITIHTVNYKNEETTNEFAMDISINENCKNETIQTNTTISKDIICELNSKTSKKQDFYLEYDDTPLKLYNRRQEIRPAADRYIPSRTGNNWQTEFSNIDRNPVEPSLKKIKDSTEENNSGNIAYNCILRNELLGESIEGVKGYWNELQAVSSPENKNLFKFSSPTNNDQNDETHSYSLSPVGPKTQKLLRSPCKSTRKISKIPFKVLDAPDLQNDFYLNLVDWSSQNMLSVGLGSSVYLWSAFTSQVVRLCDLSNEANSITSVAWNDRGNHLAIGTHNGLVQIWDIAVSKKIKQLSGHSARVGSAAWNGNILATGSRDKMIIVRDIRIPDPAESVCCVYTGHRQEVCGLKWSPDGQYLASGGNDNHLYVWNQHSMSPFQSYADHSAAIKAIAWSPHQHGLLASGGGTADRCIRFWNTLTGQPIQCIDTGSQVCNLAWSKNSSELVSTHGYSQNQIVVWKYPSLTQVVKLTGHSYRVLYLAMSPDGESIVTGAGDETLRFWNIFSKTSSQKENKSVLNLFSSIR